MILLFEWIKIFYALDRTATVFGPRIFMSFNLFLNNFFFNPLKPEFLLSNIYNSVRTSQETYYVSATEASLLMLFREISDVYCENHMKHTNTLRGQNAKF
jgi:hypothetical protein